MIRAIRKVSMESLLSQIERSLVLATYFRSGRQSQTFWTSNADQIIAISLFYTGDLSVDECTDRFAVRGYVKCLYNSSGDLLPQIESRYQSLIGLVRGRSDLIEGGGDFDTPADPTYTSCRLTFHGLQLAPMLANDLPAKPHFPNWPDQRTLPIGG
ncbi:hypothetical protein C2E31_13480 [Rhodopirellula baltica]|nr:hypothetical protein C2E31_13480 [Rhodopirellula baltica]